MNLRSRKTRIRLISYALAAMLTLGGFLWRSEREKAVLQNYIEGSWERAFASLASDLTRIDTALIKLRCSSSPALMGQAAAEVWSRAEDAQQSLGQLPFSAWLLEDTAAFLGKLGDYALAVSRRAYRGALSSEERQSLQKLEETASRLNARLLELQAELDGGGLRLGRLETAERSLEPGETLLGDRMLETEEEFPELPTLIYDGPFSESAATPPARMLEGLGPVSEADAVKAASAFTGLPAEMFTVLGKSEGSLPCWLLTAGDVTLRVTRQGGLVADMTDASGGWEGRLSPEEALEKARAFLSERGYAGAEESYWTKEEGSILFCFHGVQDGVICYPDLVKLRLDLSSGRAIGFEAAGWLMSHRQRSFPEAAGASQARSAVSPGLRILSEGLALIPTEGKEERLCWEFKCEDDRGQHVIVYADALTGEEVKLLLLLEDENGTLVL